jgi:heterodisulfide reductase subunit C
MTLPPFTIADAKASKTPFPGSLFSSPIDPDWASWREIAVSSNADIDMCWTCGTCDNGCPVNQATGRLRPQRTLRMAVYGMIDELLSLPDAWYCLLCRRCQQGCPNGVEPYMLNRYLRFEAIRREVISIELLDAYRKLFAEFQRVRWRAATHCFNNNLDHLSDHTWYQWLKKPIRNTGYRPVILGRKPTAPPLPHNEISLPSHACITCSECSSSCPVICDNGVFDPQRIVRKATLGMADELLRSPAIWLCLGCQRCTEACSQTVSGHALIQRLQQQAIENGVVDGELPIRLLEADRIIYPKFLDAIDSLIGLYRLKS